MDALTPCTVETLARRKSLDPKYLRDEFGLRDAWWYGQDAVEIPVRDRTGRHLYSKLRLADGSARRRPSGGSYVLYALERLPALSSGDDVLIVEGESDTWACWSHGIAAFGVPGASQFHRDSAMWLRPFRCVLWEEPGAAGESLTVDVARFLPSARVITGDCDVKDPCELHQREGGRFAEVLAERVRRAVSVTARATAILAGRPPAHASIARLSSPRSVTSCDVDFAAQLARARRVRIDELLRSLGFELHGRGASRTMRCPFHDDSRPSLSVSVNKGLWKCHGCGVAGDGISFVMRLKGLDFCGAVATVST